MPMLYAAVPASRYADSTSYVRPVGARVRIVRGEFAGMFGRAIPSPQVRGDDVCVLLVNSVSCYFIHVRDLLNLDDEGR